MDNDALTNATPNQFQVAAEPGAVRVIHHENDMRFLNWNHRKVQNLTPWEIWGFVAGRVLMSFGLGVLAMQYFPQGAASLGIPTLIIGFLLLVFAAKGLARNDVPKS